MLRLTVAASLLFTARFRIYLYFVLPSWIISQQLIIMCSEKKFVDSAQNCAESVLPKDYSSRTQFTRDFFLILMVTVGIYSHSRALVSRFIISEKSLMQQK